MMHTRWESNCRPSRCAIVTDCPAINYINIERLRRALSRLTNSDKRQPKEIGVGPPSLLRRSFPQRSQAQYRLLPSSVLNRRQ